MRLFPIIVFLPSRFIFCFLSCHVATFSEGIVRDHCRVIRPLHQALSVSDNTGSTQPWKLPSLWFPFAHSKTTLPETKDLHSTFITVFMTKQCSTAAENIRGSGEEKLLLIRSLLRKNQIKPIDLITHRLRLLMVIVKYKCVWKGTDSPKVQICVEAAESVFNL